MTLRLRRVGACRSHDPASTTHSSLTWIRFGLFPVRSPLLGESRLFSFPPGTEMVHFPGFASPGLCIQPGIARVYLDGFPHSDISGSKPV